MSEVSANLPSGSLDKVIPKDSVNAVVGGLMGEINGKLGGSAQLNGALPTGLPSSYVDASGETKPLDYEGGMTLGNIVDWCAYLAVKTYADAGAVVKGSASGSASGNMGGSVSFGISLGGSASGSADGGFSMGGSIGKRAHARALRV